MGSCIKVPSLNKASARCRRTFLSTDMSRRTFWITVPRVNSTSNAVALQSASWKSGMQSLKASAISFSSGSPGRPSCPGLPSPGGGGADEEDAAPPPEGALLGSGPSPPTSGTSSTSRFSRLSFRRPTSGRICTRYLPLSASKPQTMPTSSFSSGSDRKPRNMTMHPEGKSPDTEAASSPPASEAAAAAGLTGGCKGESPAGPLAPAPAGLVPALAALSAAVAGAAWGAAASGGLKASASCSCELQLAKLLWRSAADSEASAADAEASAADAEASFIASSPFFSLVAAAEAAARLFFLFFSTDFMIPFTVTQVRPTLPASFALDCAMWTSPSTFAITRLSIPPAKNCRARFA
mmetsp:Transcript_6729/g.18152  ORF Transcript_6729/g.18152 Transcript_6729/m.18152 type:complete len:352 (-) Transcript_6729:258-1313(-)